MKDFEQLTVDDIIKYTRESCYNIPNNVSTSPEIVGYRTNHEPDWRTLPDVRLVENAEHRQSTPFNQRQIVTSVAVGNDTHAQPTMTILLPPALDRMNAPQADIKVSFSLTATNLIEAFNTAYEALVRSLMAAASLPRNLNPAHFTQAETDFFQHADTLKRIPFKLVPVYGHTLTAEHLAMDLSNAAVRGTSVVPWSVTPYNRGPQIISASLMNPYPISNLYNTWGMHGYPSGAPSQDTPDDTPEQTQDVKIAWEWLDADIPCTNDTYTIYPNADLNSFNIYKDYEKDYCALGVEELKEYFDTERRSFLDENEAQIVNLDRPCWKRL